MAAAQQPKVWVLTGYRAGESSQLIALAEALGWPFAIKRLVYKKTDFLISLPRLVGTQGIDIAQSSPLAPPWPDVIITAGLRNEPIARWIRRHSGGKARLVHIGRPWAGLEHFDLIITTPQYRLPDRPNVLHNHTTLHRVTGTRLDEAAQAWAPQFAHLPKPYIAVLVGGHSGPYTLDAPTAARLGAQASTLAGAQGGALLVTTSARTPPEATAALVAAITTPAYVFRWTPDAKDNPYYAYLALADAFVVTGESISMLTEACATQKPVYIFPFGQGAFAMGEKNTTVDPLSLANWFSSSAHLRAFLYSQLMHAGPRRLTRDLRLVHHHLLAAGRAVWLGQPFPQQLLPPLEDLARAVRRVQALFK